MAKRKRETSSGIAEEDSSLDDECYRGYEVPDFRYPNSPPTLQVTIRNLTIEI